MRLWVVDEKVLVLPLADGLMLIVTVSTDEDSVMKLVWTVGVLLGWLVPMLLIAETLKV
ncbi:MAG: hypothetical protein ACOX0Z_02070 [Candidatus Nanosyncoccaceae bacterium]|jgi:hypothetical protein